MPDIGSGAATVRLLRRTSIARIAREDWTNCVHAAPASPRIGIFHGPSFSLPLTAIPCATVARAPLGRRPRG